MTPAIAVIITAVARMISVGLVPYCIQAEGGSIGVGLAIETWVGLGLVTEGLTVEVFIDYCIELNKSNLFEVSIYYRLTGVSNQLVCT